MYVRKPWMVMIPLLVLLLLLAGCGGKSKAESAPAEATAVPPTATASAPVGDATKGEAAFQATCIACHGADALGVVNLGKSLHASDSEFMRTHSDDELVEFIKVGRQPDDPLNTTGIAMPPKGGNPAVSDEDLYNIVAWLRTLE